MRILLLPPDERPVHTRLARDVAAVAGATLCLPPTVLLPSFRSPGDVDGLAEWLVQQAASVDLAIVSLEGLCHGGLLASRITDDPTDVVVGRLGSLRRVHEARPDLHLDVTGVITRLPDIDDATEEPTYWATHGRRLAELSRQLDRAVRGAGDPAALSVARAAVPAVIADEVLRRRVRNHALLLASLDLLGDGTVDTGVISADDTAPEGLPAREADLIDEWASALQLGDRLGRYSGADEVAAVRIARWTGGASRRPTIALLDETGLDRIAPYEGEPLSETVAGQVQAVGGRSTGERDAADLLLAVVPPEPDGDHALSPPAPDAARDRRLRACAHRIADAVEAGRTVAVADCAFPNGGSPAVVDALRERGVLHRLAAYAGWNTAGNSIGSALAQAVAGQEAGGPGSAHERLLAHRLLEDVGYQAQVRTCLRRTRADAGRAAEPAPDELDAVTADVAGALDDRLLGLGELGRRWRISAGSVQLPWGRTFECDFELEPRDG